MKVRDPPPSSSVIFSSKKWLGTGAPCAVRYKAKDTSSQNTKEMRL